MAPVPFRRSRPPAVERSASEERRVVTGRQSRADYCARRYIGMFSGDACPAGRLSWATHPATWPATQAAVLAPAEKSPAGPRIGAARVRVAEVGSEEFDVAPAGRPFARHCSC
jgi:hypothetical protein